eukprot:7942517-Pyramimonas_sp.AAC.1
MQPWADDGGFIFKSYHSVLAGLGNCLYCLAQVQSRRNAQTSYLSGRGKGALISAWTSLRLASYLSACPPDGGDRVACGGRKGEISEMML